MRLIKITILLTYLVNFINANAQQMSGEYFYGSKQDTTNSDSSKRKFEFRLRDDKSSTVGDWEAGEYDGAVLMPVHIWGAVHTTGQFRVPKRTNLASLISYARGPLTNADLENVTLKRRSEGRERIFKVNVKKMLNTPGVYGAQLMPDDIIIIDKQKSFFKGNTTATITLVGSILSVVLTSIILSEKLK